MSRQNPPLAIIVADEDVSRLVRDLQRDGLQVTEHDIRDILDSRSARRERQNEMRRQLAEAMKDIPAPPAPVPIGLAPRRGSGKRGQRAAARARRGTW